MYVLTEPVYPVLLYHKYFKHVQRKTWALEAVYKMRISVIHGILYRVLQFSYVILILFVAKQLE